MTGSGGDQLLKVTYAPQPGSDVEHGQGAIERNELRHRPLDATSWLILVPPGGEPAIWKKRLDDAVDPRHGSFSVTRASADEQARAARGEITFQQ